MTTNLPLGASQSFELMTRSIPTAAMQFARKESHAKRSRVHGINQHIKFAVKTIGMNKL